MAYDSTVYRILIASPSDVDEEREMASRIIQEWNDLNSFTKKIVLLPVRWETHTSPTYGHRPQEIINKQIVDDCDLLIGFFWTKIGTPTGEDISGTIEEITRVSKAGKPVMLYFSKRGKDPSSIELSQMESLNKFKSEVYKIALVEHFSSIVEFRDKVSRQLEMKIRELQGKTESAENLITFSFINELTGELESDDREIHITTYNANNTDVDKIVKTYSKNRWHFRRDLQGYIDKKNNVPVVFGIKNNSDRVLGSAVFELKLTSSIENDLSIQAIVSSESDSMLSRIYNYSLSNESEQNVLKLFQKSLVQTSPKTWEFSSKPFTLLPHKLKIFDLIVLLFPKSTMKIDFSINLFSDNLFHSIRKTCSLTINVDAHNVTYHELEEMAVQLPDDDLPF